MRLVRSNHRLWHSVIRCIILQIIMSHSSEAHVLVEGALVRKLLAVDIVIASPLLLQVHHLLLLIVMHGNCIKCIIEVLTDSWRRCRFQVVMQLGSVVARHFLGRKISMGSSTELGSTKFG